MSVTANVVLSVSYSYCIHVLQVQFKGFKDLIQFTFIYIVPQKGDITVLYIVR